MASNYPGALDTFTDKTNDVDNVDASHVNNLQDAVEAIQGELGTDPAGASATVKARLDALDTTVSGKAASSHTHAAADLASGTIATARLGSGTASSSTYLRGDQTWATVTGGVSSVVGQTGAVTGTQIVADATVAAALAAKAALASPTFTGTPAGPTAAAGTSTTQLATTAFVQAAVGASLFSANATGATTVDAANGAVQILTLTGNATFTLAAVAPGAAVTLTLILKQDATGGRTVTWPPTVDWGGGSAPTLSTAGDADDIVTLFTVDGGTTKWFGFQQNASGGGGAAGFYGVVAAANSQGIGTATVSTIGFNGTDVYDESGNEWHSTSTNNPRLTVPAGRAGKIRFEWAIAFGGNATGDRQLRVRKNGTAEFFTQTVKAATLSTVLIGQTTVFDAIVGDYYELRAYQDSGATLNVSGTFGATWLGA